MCDEMPVCPRSRAACRRARHAHLDPIRFGHLQRRTDGSEINACTRQLSDVHVELLDFNVANVDGEIGQKVPHPAILR